MRHTEDFKLKKMIWIYMIITSLATAALSKGCNLTDPAATTKQCFGELGEPLIFYLPAATTRLSLQKNNTVIFQLPDNTATSDNNNKKDKKISFFKNSTLKLNKASKEDSGDYLMEIHDSTSGKLLHKKSIHVEIQAPVSKPAVSQTCLSPEQMTVSCSSEGDGAEIILSLDNNLLIHSRDTEKHSVSNVTISLHGQLTGNLMCDVQNNISREQTVIQLTGCSGNVCSHLSPLIAAVIASVSTLLLLLVVFLGIRCFNKTTSNKTTSPVTAGTDDTAEEIVYSDVRVKTPARKTRCN